MTVVTIYASLGEEALCHSLNEVCSLTALCHIVSLIPNREFLCENDLTEKRE